jgi:hypothetical protein
LTGPTFSMMTLLMGKPAPCLYQPSSGGLGPL